MSITVRTRSAALLSTAVLGFTVLGTLGAQPAFATPGTCNGLMITQQVMPGVPFVGGAGPDVIGGTPYADNIDGGGGDDTICGWAENDTISGGEGDDWISGAADNDTISGGANNDVLYGNEGVDDIEGNDGNDTLRGGDDRDTLYGNSGDDIMHCGDGGGDFADGGNGGEVLGDFLVSAANHGCEFWVGIP